MNLFVLLVLATVAGYTHGKTSRTNNNNKHRLRKRVRGGDGAGRRVQDEFLDETCVCDGDWTDRQDYLGCVLQFYETELPDLDTSERNDRVIGAAETDDRIDCGRKQEAEDPSSSATTMDAPADTSTMQYESGTDSGGSSTSSPPEDVSETDAAGDGDGEKEEPVHVSAIMPGCAEMPKLEDMMGVAQGKLAKCETDMQELVDAMVELAPEHHEEAKKLLPDIAEKQEQMTTYEGEVNDLDYTIRCIRLECLKKLEEGDTEHECPMECLGEPGALYKKLVDDKIAAETKRAQCKVDLEKAADALIKDEETERMNDAGEEVSHIDTLEQCVEEQTSIVEGCEAAMASLDKMVP